MRRFIVDMDNGKLIGVECEDYSWGMNGLYFYNRVKTDRGNLAYYYTVLAFAPGAFELFREIPDGASWPETVKTIHKQAGWACDGGLYFVEEGTHA